MEYTYSYVSYAAFEFYFVEFIGVYLIVDGGAGVTLHGE